MKSCSKAWNVKGDVVDICNRDGKRRMSNLPIFVTYSLSHEAQIFQHGVSDAGASLAQEIHIKPKKINLCTCRLYKA